MQENKEISALFHLIDDPDEEVYNTVSERIVSMGKGIIPNLEHLWESTTDGETQARIELLIHKLHFRDLVDDFTKWKDGSGDLLQGALLVACYQYPDMHPAVVMQEIEKMRRNIWLELNSYLTPLEQINIVSGILYNYFKLKGVEIAYDSPEDFFINNVLETKKGNAITNGILYVALAELLDLPVKAVNIPRQFILGYFDVDYNYPNPAGNISTKINFFIDPLNGQIYTHKDVENYFKRISVPPTPSYFKPLTNKRIIQYLLEQLSKCYDDDKNRYKQNDLFYLASLLEE
jgi:regulator of sirC expression with transglutaminase-like and TPR domain